MKDYVLEDTPEGITLVITGTWSNKATKLLRDGKADGLTLNYAKGFSDGNLSFVEDWPLRRLNILDRSIEDLAPVARLAPVLEELSVQASPLARLTLPDTPKLRRLAGTWPLIRDTAQRADNLVELNTHQFDEANLVGFVGHSSLAALTIKDAPRLESLDGIEALRSLSALGVHLARKLTDISTIRAVASTMGRLSFEYCSGVNDLTPLNALTAVSHLNVSDCRRIESLGPLRAMTQLESFYAWGSTAVADGDLSPLLALPRLRNIRMKSRKEYRPTLEQVRATLGITEG